MTFEITYILTLGTLGIVIILSILQYAKSVRIKDPTSASKKVTTKGSKAGTKKVFVKQDGTPLPNEIKFCFTCGKKFKKPLVKCVYGVMHRWV